MWKATKSWLHNNRDVIRWAVVFCFVWYFALRSTASQEFITSMATALAWPLILLILVGYRYRRPLEELIGRVQQLEGIGISLKTGDKAYGDDQAQKLRKKLHSESTDPATKEALERLLSLSVESLRLLGILAAVGTRQRLDLTVYTSRRLKSAPAFRRAIGELLEQSLITREGRWYRPTLQGIAVLKLHLENVEGELKLESRRESKLGDNQS